MMRKRNMTSGRSQENSFIVITLYQESNCTCREKKLSYSDEVHRRYQNNIYVTGRNVGEKYLRLLERGWWKRIIGRMDRLHKIHSSYWTQGHLMGTHGPERDCQENKRLQGPDNVWPDMWTHMSDAAIKRAKRRWTIEEPKLDNARQLRGIFLIEQNDEEFKLTIKAARRKLEIPMQQQCLAKYR